MKQVSQISISLCSSSTVKSSYEENQDYNITYPMIKKSAWLPWIDAWIAVIHAKFMLKFTHLLFSSIPVRESRHKNIRASIRGMNSAHALWGHESRRWIYSCREKRAWTIHCLNNSNLITVWYYRQKPYRLTIVKNSIDRLEYEHFGSLYALDTSKIIATFRLHRIFV